MSEDLGKYKDLFLREAKEHVGAMNDALLDLEKNPTELELISRIFREAHTLKSMAATMYYDKIVELCHAMEDVLDAIRKKRIEPGSCVDSLFECFDALDSTLKELENNREELDASNLVDKLRRLALADYIDISAMSAEEPTASTITKIRSIGVKVERLDLLMNLVEELLINKMRLDRLKEDLQNPELAAAVDTLARLIADVQYNVMQARMVPVGFVFNRFPRMVRDLAKSQEKEVNLQMEGSDIELDRTVIDEIGESLVHLLKNAIDHGIEGPQERKAAGKPAQGLIRLTATRTKNSAVIEVADDGAGVDFEVIRNKAIRGGILSPQASREEVIDSIFSGLSTSKHVTTVSGRGFGLNIVKNKINSLGGTIKVESGIKQGTRFVIEVPLTLAVIKALFVEVAGKPYAIPLASVERLVTVNKDDIKGMLDFEAIVLDEEDIPITRLDLLFGAPSPALAKQPIVIVRKGDHNLGLAVDAFLKTQEIVIKVLNKLIKENKYFAGTTIIGSGEVVLILDVANLILTKRTPPDVFFKEREYGEIA